LQAFSLNRIEVLPWTVVSKLPETMEISGKLA
jgi:hypothetical protein